MEYFLQVLTAVIRKRDRSKDKKSCLISSFQYFNTSYKPGVYNFFTKERIPTASPGLPSLKEIKI